MSNILITRRSLRGVLLLLLSSLVLFLSNHGGIVSTDNVPALKTSVSSVKGITLPNKHETRFLNFWSHSRHSSPGHSIRRATVEELPSYAKDGIDTMNTANSKVLTKRQSTSDSRFVKRDKAETYEKAKCTGAKMWPKIQSAMAGHEPAGEVFQPSELDNGWTRSKDIRLGLDNRRREYIDKELGPNKIPPSDQISFIELDQYYSFKDRKGQETPSNKGPKGWPHYYSYYAPNVSTIVVSNMVSPMNMFKKLMKNEQEMPSNEEIKDRYIPPLSRWSDVAWVVYSRVCAKTPGWDPKKLQFIGHDTVIGSDTIDVVDFVMERYYKGSGRASMPFPGLELGMNQEEGLALLGSPNGMGTGWLMYDRARDLGRRDLKVRIWHPDITGTRIMMAFYMKPA